MAERMTPEGIRAFLAEKFNGRGWHSASVVHELTNDMLDVIGIHFSRYDKSTKLGVLFALLYIRKADLSEMRENMEKIIQHAIMDPDEWVSIIGRICKGVPNGERFQTDLENWSPNFKSMFEEIGRRIQTEGVGFHPSEFALLLPEVRQPCAYGTESFKSNQPTLHRYFSLSDRPGDTLNEDERKNKFKAALEEEERTEHSIGDDVAEGQVSDRLQAASPVVTPPSKPLLGNAMYSKAAGPLPFNASVEGHLPPRPPRPAVASNLFIHRAPPRRPSAGLPSFLKPAAPRPSQIYGRPNRPESASSAQASTPKGFVKQTKTAFLNFNDATMLQQSNTEAIERANQAEQQIREAQKRKGQEERKRMREEDGKKRRAGSRRSSDANSVDAND